ncbi:MAG: beta-glycosidase [Bacteroides sp.]|nr:beta-glycosidase [Bacteroides sp.]
MGNRQVYRIIVFLLFACNIVSLEAQQNQVIDLSGYWNLFVDLEHKYSIDRKQDVLFTDTIILPATLDEAKKGIQQRSGTSTRLMRNYLFEGRAWYQKKVTIPASWKDKTKLLHLERTKVTHIWVDNTYIGHSLRITPSQKYDLTPYLTTGDHLITILVDNGADCGLPDVIRSSHQWSDETQTNWNGILGDISLIAKPSIHISSVQVYPDVSQKEFTLKTRVTNHTGSTQQTVLSINACLFNSAENQVPPTKQTELSIEPGTKEYNIRYELGNDARLWSEYSPNLYRLNLAIQSEKKEIIDTYTLSAGLREFRANGKALTINGTRIFLRGKHDGCVFPLTGYAPMTVSDWMRYFDILRSYGFNHVRFHSWCPPSAAFEAADLKGFYLQPELPIWGGIDEEVDSPVNSFLIREGKGLMDDFGNHPSFVCFSTGNELWGSIDGMKEITRQLRDYDNRHLYALGSNFHLGWTGEQGTEDIMVACRVGGHNDATFEPHVRSSFSFADAINGGWLNATYPNTVMNFNRGVAQTTKPVIAHETGQFQIYPNPRELKKYTGVLAPYNLERFCRLTAQKHGTEKTERFFQASGALSLLCYKADIEMSMRTADLAGFQMLDIQDFPGQGTALVGLLDAFMDSKGLTTPEEFSSFNAEVVPLWESQSYTWYNHETLTGTIKLFNYAKENLKGVTIDWQLIDSQTGLCLKSGAVTHQEVTRGLADMGTVAINLTDIKEAKAMQLSLSVRNTRYNNKYNLWVYPKVVLKKPSSVEVFTQVNEELWKTLRQGKKVLLMPSADTYPEQTVGGLFTNDYWNYSMFKTISENAGKPVSPGTLGYLIENEHPLFRYFPTSFHSDWQWWAPARNARPIIMDSLSSEVGMIVEAIDNAERNHKLGVLFECKIGKGKLLVCMADLMKGKEYKECEQLQNAIYHYMNSAAFAPKYEITPEELSMLFSSSITAPSIQGVKNVSY